MARGLEVLDAVAEGATTLVELANAIGLTRSTTHRLAATLVERRYLDFSRGDGYTLGPKLLELGYITGRRMDLPRVARDHLEALAAATGDTVHLGMLDGSRGTVPRQDSGQPASRNKFPYRGTTAAALYRLGQSAHIG